MRYVTFYYDLLSDHVSDLKVHKDKETALNTSMLIARITFS